MRYYLGLDNGGTTTKAALFDNVGREIGVHSVTTAMITPKPGFVERDMEELWQANCTVIRRVLEKTGVSANHIAGVGICGHGKGLYLWGKNGSPARNGILSSDNRAYEYPARWTADGIEAKVFERSCQHIMACQPVALLAWLRDNEPSVFSNIDWVFECKDYVRFRLTGEAKAEMTDCSGTNLMNLYTRKYDEELMRLFGLSMLMDALPPLCLSAEICGHVTAQSAKLCGLVAGTPVIGGMFDIDACALAVNVTDEENICMIAGTWSINEYLRREPVIDGSVLMNSLFCLPDYYLVEESSATSAGNNEWFVTRLMPEYMAEVNAANGNPYKELDNLVAELPPEEYIPIFLPFLMASNVHPNAKGTFVGMSVNHTRAHLLRSIYEGIVFCHRHHLEKLLSSRETSPHCVRLAGGAARSVFWTQMFADILQLPVETVAVNETGALGCAIATAVAVGDYPTLGEAAKRMTSIAPTVLPDSTLKALYDRRYALYKKTIECLDPLWSEMQTQIDGKGETANV
jgi:L-xylulokinase